MRPERHAWDVTPAEAVEIQERLREWVAVAPLEVAAVRTIGGCDLSADRQRGEVYAGIVVLDAADLSVVDEVAIEAETSFPYIPGLLSFREIPPMLTAWERLRVRPDVLVCDGHGYAHPRRFGLASHAGVILDLPTVGCAKSIFVGRCDEPGTKRGARSLLLDGDEVIGAAVRTRDSVKPVYVSVGHRCRLDDAAALVLRASRRYRLPEPTRLAHHLVNRLRRGEAEP